MTTEVIETFIASRRPVLMTIKVSRLVTKSVTATLDRVDGQHVVTTEGRRCRLARITSIARADALDGLKT